MQCVCTKSDTKVATYPGVRTAAKEQKGLAEDWSYHQDRVFFESNKKFGTYYPEWRYYGSRDFSSAFGADYLLDYLNDNKEVPKVSPNTQFLGAYQTMCLSRIRAHLITLRSILEGLRNCIQEAKYTGLQDAGVCKTIFTQQVCGLVYKAIAYFVNQCTPNDLNDDSKGVLGGVGEVVDASFSSIGEAMQSSIDDVQRDYDNAVLNQYFAGGSQGLTESMCMAAFGYDWPLGADFILDAAYAVPGKTTTHVLPALRELSTFDPTTGNAVYNYEVGAMILPGCRIQSYDVYLKCISQEDNPNGNRPNVFCGGDQPCDCLYTTQTTPAAERIHNLDGGRGFDLAQNSFVSVPIPSPQRVNKPFRFDHVVVDLKLAQGFNADTCFDDGYKDGKFYFRITDVSPPALGVCQIDTFTGKYQCPDLVSLFGGGAGAYLQDPYVSCFNAKTQSWAPCTTPNIFTKGEEIKVRANAVSDGKKYCVRMSSTGLPQENVQIRQLPEGIPGTFPVEIFLGTVNDGLFSGAATTVVLSGGQSAQGCSQPLLDGSASINVESQPLPFQYQSSGSGKFIVTAPAGVQIVDAPYDLNGNILRKNGVQELSSTEIQQAKFSYNGFQFYNVVGSPQVGQGQCVYQVVKSAGSTFKQNEKSISVTAELYLPDAVGNCYNYDQRQRVKSTAGKNPWTQQITLRLEPLISVLASKIYQDFINRNYANVIGVAEGLIARKAADIQEVEGFYYLVAGKIAQAEDQSKVSWKLAFKDDVCYLIDLFKTRKGIFRNEEITLANYSADVKGSAEYEKVQEYFKEISNSAQCGT